MKRELNEIEYLTYCMGQPYNIVTVVRLRGALTADRLRAALDKAQQRHPLLRANTILDRSGIPWLTSEGVGPIPLTVLKRENDDYALRITQKELHAQFDMDKPGKSRKPLMRVTLLQPTDPSAEPSDVILCAQHTISDGMSMVFLARDLLLFMTDPKQPVHPLDVTASTQDIFPPEVRSRIPKSFAEVMASLRLMVPPDIREHLPTSETELLAFLKLMKPVPEAVPGDAATQKPEIEPPSSMIHSWQLTVDESQAFIARCRQEQVTVQSALCAAFLTIFTAVNTPVNLRPRLALPVDEAFGAFASGAVVRMEYDPKQGFWDNARQFHSKLQQELRDPFTVYTRFSKDVPVQTMQGFIQSLAALVSDQRPFAITNLGSLDKIGLFLQIGDLRVESFFGVISPGILTNAIAVIVYTINGIMRFHLHYMEPGTTTAEIKKFTRKAMSLLKSAIKNPAN